MVSHYENVLAVNGNNRGWLCCAITNKSEPHWLQRSQSLVAKEWGYTTRLRRSRTEKMPNTYTQIHLHFVFAVKHRQSLIAEAVRIRVEKYITGIVQNFGHKLLAIYCMPDHTHLFTGFRPAQSVADFMREVKSGSAEFINQQQLATAHFNWQEGYGAFSYSHSHVPNVVNYILTQPEHHRKRTFREEYLDLLKKFDIAYNENYLFTWIDDGPTPAEP